MVRKMKKHIQLYGGWWTVEWEFVPYITFMHCFRWGYGHLQFRWLALIAGIIWDDRKK